MGSTSTEAVWVLLSHQWTTSYLGIGDISCSTTSACLALGGGAQSAPSTPIYRYEENAP